MKRPTPKQLAAAFHVELDKDGWGDIDPWLFREIVEDKEDDWDEDAKSLFDVLTRVIARLMK